MKSPLCLVLPHVVFADSTRTTVTPIQKVIQLMNGMLAKGEQEKHEENVAFSTYSQWCGDTKVEKETDIKNGADAVTQLEADITKAEADIQKLGDEIKELDGNINEWEGRVAKAKAERERTKSEYQVTHKDYSESVSALERAIVTLKKRAADTSQSLVQLKEVVSMPRVPASAKQALTAFLQSNGELSAPEANAYESQSGSIVEMLEKLKLKFEDERLALEKEESNRIDAFNMLDQQLGDDIAYAKTSRTRKIAKKGERQKKSADAKADLVMTQKSKKDDEKFLQETLSECEQKGKDFTARQQTRAGEIVAIKKAIEIISSPAVSGAGEKHLPQLLQKGSAMAQLRSTNNSPDTTAVRNRVAEMLMQSAERSKSQLLAAVAGQVTEDPFAKIKKMIKDMIVKLVAEAEGEADHKQWCDEELSTNKATRDEKSAKTEDLSAQIDELDALDAKLTDQIANLQEAVEELTANMKETTEMRKDEKAKNQKTIEESQQAAAAVSMAMQVLQKFYDKAATSTAFVQPKPATFDTPYRGMSGESGGVLGMMEVIQSDFARLKAETTSAENNGQREYDHFMASAQEDKATKEKEGRHKGFELTRTKRASRQAKEDLKSTQEELDAALQYFDKLKPTCIGETPRYEERVARRKEEIESLKEALRILSDGL